VLVEELQPPRENANDKDKPIASAESDNFTVISYHTHSDFLLLKIDLRANTADHRPSSADGTSHIAIQRS
jgi:hypothetical protein